MSEPAHAANVLGAVALAISDRATAAAAAATDQSVSVAAALSALAQFADGATLDRLRGVLGLTASGTVRLVDRLEHAGLATRQPGPDGRTRAVTLTAEGRAAAEGTRAARMAYLDALVATLSDAEVETLDALLGKVMTAVVEEKDGGAWICRLCDLPACGREERRCPANVAAMIKHNL